MGPLAGQAEYREKSEEALRRARRPKMNEKKKKKKKIGTAAVLRPAREAGIRREKRQATKRETNVQNPKARKPAGMRRASLQATGPAAEAALAAPNSRTVAVRAEAGAERV